MQGAGAGAQTKDSQFNYVSMLLHGDGTNGARNNTFLDGSTNTFSIAPNGNTSQGSFSPYGPNWSNYFSGSSNLSVPNNAVFTLTADFTIECWFFQTGAFQDRLIISKWPTEYYIYTRANGVIGFAWGPYNASGMFGIGGIVQSGNNGFALNTWTHVAAVRNSNTFTLYVNGVSISTATFSTGGTDSGEPVTIGDYGSGGYAFAGYISNARIVKGTAVYTANFTPSTTPLTAISGTSLLTCADNRFIDDSTNNFTITSTATSVQRFNPFGTATAYSTGVIGGSGFFDGNGDYLTATLTGQAFATSNFTMECWAYATSLTETYNGLTGSRPNSADGSTTNYSFGVQSNGSVYFYSGSFLVTSSVGAIKLNSWNHIALVRSGTGSSQSVIYVNGVSAGTGTISNNLSGTSFAIGALASGQEPFTGYITDVRLNNTAVYTTAFTPPTAPLTAISGTALLANFTNAAIFDNAMMHNLETTANGTAQISTSVVKYGTGSINNNGTTSFPSGTATKLRLRPNPNFSFGTGDFTVEGWFYQTTIGSTYQSILEINNHLGADGILFIGNTSGVACVYAAGTGGGGFVAQQATTANVWQHIAFVRNNGTLRTYVNGVSTSSQAGFTLNIQCTTALTIGGEFSGDGNYNYYGYIDDFRVTRYARYTANFTPPTKAFFDTGPV